MPAPKTKLSGHQNDSSKFSIDRIPMLLIDPALAGRLGLQAQLFEQLTMPIRKTLPLNKWFEKYKWFEKSSQIPLAFAS